MRKVIRVKNASQQERRSLRWTTSQMLTWTTLDDELRRQCEKNVANGVDSSKKKNIRIETFFIL